jgi:hypothetical protein
MADDAADADDDDWDDPAGRRNSEPDASVTPELFKEWRSPRYGRSNPERINNPVWEWLIRCRVSAYWANDWFKGPSSCEIGPCWCFRRFGQSKTKLPDGRIVLVAGEHEDSYDPDFFIYNDVVVKNPDGSVEIYGYPREIFNPTDFHSATLVDDRIVLIGSLGYHKERIPGFTQVYSLDLRTFAISAMNCTGDAPGWLHKHDATYLPAEGTIVVSGGLVYTDDSDRQFPENIDKWKLHLADKRWERLTKLQWKRWDLRREDKRMNELFSMSHAANWKQWVDNKWRPIAGVDLDPQLELKKAMDVLKEDLGFEPDLDLLADLYNPPIPHEKIPDIEDEFRVHRININGVTVRYNEDSYGIRLTIEGDLPTATAEILTSDLMNKLSMLEHQKYELIRL